MRIILVAGLALALGACGGGETETTETNTMTIDNSMMMDENAAMDANMGGNMAMDPDTHNMMMNDMNTNAPDTNLANGL